MAADELDGYLQKAKSFDRLNAATRAALLARVRSGDTEAEERLVESLLLKTAQSALASKPDSLPAIVAVQEANLVLMELIRDTTIRVPERGLAAAISRRLREVALSWPPSRPA